jgi:tetratricopeptide (TPR) repeat protein
MAIDIARVAVAQHAIGPGALGGSLEARGHLREAWETLPSVANHECDEAILATDLALFGVLPSDSASFVFGRCLRGRRIFFSATAWWWSSQGDTASVRAYVRSAESLARRAEAAVAEREVRPRVSLSEGGSGLPEFSRYVADGGRAYLALARRDTNEALHRLEVLPDTLCDLCTMERLTTAQLLAARGRYREAAAVLDQRSFDFPSPLYVLWALERARVHERLRDREQAIESYTFVVDAWRNADPELQRYVIARAALKRLGASRARVSFTSGPVASQVIYSRGDAAPPFSTLSPRTGSLWTCPPAGPIPVRNLPCRTDRGLAIRSAVLDRPFDGIGSALPHCLPQHAGASR